MSSPCHNRPTLLLSVVIPEGGHRWRCAICSYERVGETAELRAEVERLAYDAAYAVTFRPGTVIENVAAAKPAKIATWGPMRYVRGGVALRGNGRIIGSFQPYRGKWSACHSGWSDDFATEPEARAHIEDHAKAKGWEVAK